MFESLCMWFYQYPVAGLHVPQIVHASKATVVCQFPLPVTFSGFSGPTVFYDVQAFQLFINFAFLFKFCFHKSGVGEGAESHFTAGNVAHLGWLKVKEKSGWQPRRLCLVKEWAAFFRRKPLLIIIGTLWFMMTALKVRCLMSCVSASWICSPPFRKLLWLMFTTTATSLWTFTCLYKPAHSLRKAKRSEMDGNTCSTTMTLNLFFSSGAFPISVLLILLLMPALYFFIFFSYAVDLRVCSLFLFFCAWCFSHRNKFCFLFFSYAESRLSFFYFLKYWTSSLFQQNFLV